MYNKVDTNLNFVDREKQVREFWKDNDIFKKSMEQRKQPALYPLSDPDFSSFHFLPHFLLQLQHTFLLPDTLLHSTDNEVSCSLSITISNHLSQSIAPAPHGSKDDGN